MTKAKKIWTSFLSNIETRTQINFLKRLWSQKKKISKSETIRRCINDRYEAEQTKDCLNNKEIDSDES